MLYVLTNRCFPRLTMISTESPEELDTEMVPLPFKGNTRRKSRTRTMSK